MQVSSPNSKCRKFKGLVRARVGVDGNNLPLLRKTVPFGSLPSVGSRGASPSQRDSVVKECPILNVPAWNQVVDGFLNGTHDRLEPVWRGLVCALWYDQVFK